MRLPNKIMLEKSVEYISVCDIVFTWLCLSDTERNSSRSRSLGFFVDKEDGHLRYKM